MEEKKNKEYQSPFTEVLEIRYYTVLMVSDSNNEDPEHEII